MKKSLLFAGLLAMGLAVSAQNPFAYNASSGDVDGTDVPVTYSLNAPAERVIVDFIDGTGTVAKSVELDADYLTAGEHTALVSLEELTAGAEYTLAVRVKGEAITTAKAVKTVNGNWNPYGIVMDNDPMSKHFGRLLVTESAPTAPSNYYTSVAGGGVGPGIYEFTPTLEKVKNPSGTYGYNGGLSFTKYTYASGQTVQCPKQIRITNDGRLFVGTLDIKNAPLYEVNPDDLDEWTQFFQGYIDHENLDDGRVMTSDDEEAEMVAAPSVSFDFRGSGEDLTLLALGCKGGQVFASGRYTLYEYPIGTATSWSEPANEELEVIPFSMEHAVTATGISVRYDQNGGVWFCQGRAAPNEEEISLGHASKLNGDWEKDMEDDITSVRRDGGMAYNKDFSLLAMPSALKQLSIYSVDMDQFGAPTLNELYTINANGYNSRFNDITWDIAGNVYACDNGSERISIYQIPRTAAAPAGMKRAEGDDPNEVSTPLRPEFNITVPDDVNTGVSNISSKVVESVQYINMNGQVSNVPFDGVNVVITKYADGTKSTTKIVK